MGQSSSKGRKGELRWEAPFQGWSLAKTEATTSALTILLILGTAHGFTSPKQWSSCFIRRMVATDRVPLVEA